MTSHCLRNRSCDVIKVSTITFLSLIFEVNVLNIYGEVYKPWTEEELNFKYSSGGGIFGIVIII